MTHTNDTPLGQQQHGTPVVPRKGFHWSAHLALVLGAALVAIVLAQGHSQFFHFAGIALWLVVLLILAVQIASSRQFGQKWVMAGYGLSAIAVVLILLSEFVGSPSPRLVLRSIAALIFLTGAGAFLLDIHRRSG
jgi:hypothetical protein